MSNDARMRERQKLVDESLRTITELTNEIAELKERINRGIPEEIGKLERETEQMIAQIKKETEQKIDAAKKALGARKEELKSESSRTLMPQLREKERELGDIKVKLNEQQRDIERTLPR